MQPEVLAAAAWGACGGFLYASMRWFKCLNACLVSRAPTWPCHLEAVCCIVNAAIAGAAFSAAAIAISPVKDIGAVAAALGAVVNPAMPTLARTVPNLIARLVERQAALPPTTEKPE